MGSKEISEVTGKSDLGVQKEAKANRVLPGEGTGHSKKSRNLYIILFRSWEKMVQNAKNRRETCFLK